MAAAAVAKIEKVAYPFKEVYNFTFLNIVLLSKFQC